MPIAIGVDAVNLLRDRRGIGRYVRALLRVWRSSFAGRIELVLLVPHVFPGIVAARLARRVEADRVRVDRRKNAGRLGLDLVWYPWNGMTWTAPVKSVVTIHDVWPFVSPAVDSRTRTREQAQYLTAAKTANRFIAVSQHTATEAVTYLRIEPDRIDVVPNGVEFLAKTVAQPARLPGIERYVLFVGEAEPRKDIGTLVTAMSHLPESVRRSTALVLAGKRNAEVDASSAGVRVEATGEVSDERLASLYAGAAAFAFPSRHEGFGLPVLEAMQYGAPVIASDAAGIPEAGGDAAMYFPAGDDRALALALERVLEDAGLARRLSEAGRLRAGEMTQVRCAQRTLEVFERVASR
jgi:glycosyltransferase involved in cell wall biosynthesis